MSEKLSTNNNKSSSATSPTPNNTNNNINSTTNSDSNNNHTNNIKTSISNTQMESNKKSSSGQYPNLAPANVIIRERSFVRVNASNNQLNANKRRSLAIGNQQLRGKPAIELYRPPNIRLDSAAQNKLNVHAQEFRMERELQNAARNSMPLFPAHAVLQHSKSSNAMQQQIQQMAARQHAVQMANLANQRNILMSHQLSLGQMGLTAIPSSQMPLVNSPSSGNILHPSPRVKFAPELPHYHHHLQPTQLQHAQSTLTNPQITPNHLQIQMPNSLQRSKSLSSADVINRGIAGLGLGLGGESVDIGTFIPEIQTLIDQATQDPNQLNARSLMELASHIMQRAVEGRRFALPTSRFCIGVIAKEQKETFLEAVLNTCRQWYQEREKVLGPPHTIKNSSRPRFTAFMAFLTEMFCQLKRRQLQLRTKCDGSPPSLVLLTLLAKCCEDCVQPPVRSLSEIECLFFVLTCIGRDLETHLPQQLEALLSSVRDAFLNSNASAPAIRRTLLQLIELQASHWQLAGNTVLYYYPSSK